MARRTSTQTTRTLFAGGPGGIPVEVERKRVRRLNLRVRADGTAHLSIPTHVTLAEAQRFLDAHAGWLRRRLERREGLRAECAAEERADGGRVPLWGRLVELPEGATAEELWRAELARHLPEVACRMEAALGVRATGWQLRVMTSRWGSCTPATARIRINVRLAAYPPACLDYVVAHELCHLVEPSHNERFHELLATVFPHEREARAMLRQSARRLAAADQTPPPADSSPIVNAAETKCH